jgi:Mg-chelatase subunit ChlD
MRNRRIAFPLLLSFNEFAWIAAFFIALFHFSEAQRWSRALSGSSETAKQQLTSIQTQFEDERAKSDRLVTDIQELRKKTIADVEIRRQLADERTKSAKREDDIREFREKTADARTKSAKRENDIRESREKTIAAMATRIRQLESTNCELARALRETKEELAKATQREPGIRKEIVGLKGRFKRVAILFDRSRSMANGNRWNHARDVVRTWLKYLSIEQCVLITFATDTDVYPADGSFLVTQGPDENTNAQNRQMLINHLAGSNPDGGTDTLAALRKAYELKDRQGEGVDTILLFTDGEPNDGQSAGFDPIVAQKIYDLVGQHDDVPVNTIGLGTYFEGKLGGFLLNVATLSKGVFLGR